MSEPAVAVVGTRGHSTAHVHPSVARAGARLVGVCDLVEERARANARRFGGPAYTDREWMLEAEPPDGVVVRVGPEAHADLVPATTERGYDGYTEKPPAPDAASALAVARAAERTDRLCATGFEKRYAPAYEATRSWLEGRPEPLASLSVDYASASYDVPTRSRSTPAFTRSTSWAIWADRSRPCERPPGRSPPPTRSLPSSSRGQSGRRL